MRLLKRAEKYKIVFSPAWVWLEMWNQHMILDIPVLERHKDWDTLTQKLENVRSWLFVLSKTSANFMILTIYSFRNMSKNKSSISQLMKKNKFDIFKGGLIKIESPDSVGKKLWSFTVDRFGYNQDCISFFLIFQRTVKYDDHQTFLYVLTWKIKRKEKTYWYVFLEEFSFSLHC